MPRSCHLVFWCAIAILFTTLGHAEPFARAVWQWNALWTREMKAGETTEDPQVLHEGKPSVRIDHRGTKDWSREPNCRVNVQEGDIFELTSWIKRQGQGSASLSVITYDKDQNVVEWLYGLRDSRKETDWQQLKTRFVIPKGVSRITPRLTGNGPATVWIEEFQLKGIGNVAALRSGLPEAAKLENSLLSVTFHPRDVTFEVLDRRTGQIWVQQPRSGNLLVTGVRNTNGLEVDITDLSSDLKFQAAARLESAELTVSLKSTNDLSSPLAFPNPFITPTNTSLIVPLNEGISYPVSDPSIPEMHLVAYGGHGICMGFWGATDGDRGQMAILETPDDASIHLSRQNGILAVNPEWEGQKGHFGYERRLRYVFLEHGGHVAMCKRYRAYAREQGLLKTLAEKRKNNPNIDLLVGAANIWCWDSDPVSIVQELKAAGIERILWSNAAKPDAIRAMNSLGVLTSRYDIYQDVMNPETFPLLKWTHPDWPTKAWPQDLMIGSDGDWIKGWEVEGKDTNKQLYPCGVVCDRQIPSYAQQRISEELTNQAYRCRFIDTTTASPWRECYAPAHPLTRSESRRWRMELLQLISGKFKLVTGSETGHEAAVPYADYFEGMMSLAPYRVPDSGRNMTRLWDQVPQDIAKFQLGQNYRLPLWELVYHDCVVAHWYWGDYNNKLPSVWDKRDLFNILYGTPPMFMFDRELWKKNKDGFIRSAKEAAQVARATGYSEMVVHEYLTPDHSVQRTRFANGVSVIVNFGDVSFHPVGSPEVLPRGYVIKKQ